MSIKRLIGSVKSAIVPSCPGVADYDGTAKIYGRDPLPKVGVQYGKGETLILASIDKIREKYPNKRDQLAKLYELKSIANGANLSGRDADAITDIRNAIDEIEIDLGIG